MNQNEIWKPVVGYEGYYVININGVIETVPRIIETNIGRRIVKPRVRKHSINARGYEYVRLSKKGVQRNVLIHRALMEAFVPNPENKPFIDHINTIKTDNRLENLRWVSSEENTHNPLTLKHITDSCSTQECKNKQIRSKIANKSKNFYMRAVYQYTLDGIFVAKHESLASAVRFLGKNHRQCTGNIKVSLNSPTKTAYGFLWRSNPIIDKGEQKCPPLLKFT